MSEPSSTPLPETPAVDLADFGSRLAKATGGLRVKAVSWHDADGRVLWSSQPLLGIEQREAIRDALESFSGVGARLRVDRNLGDNQTAVLLRAADREGRTVGFAMLLLDSRVLLSKGRGADLPVPALQIVHEFGRLTAPRARPAPKVPASRSRDAEVAVTLPGPPPAATTEEPGDLEREYAMLRDLNVALHVQPLLPLRPNSRVRRFEVLLRSKDEGVDSHSAPVAVLERAAEKGLGTVLDRRVITQLVEALGKRPDLVLEGPSLFSVNLSATALQDEHFLKFVEATLGRAGLPASTLAFEIQAEALAKRRSSASRVAQQLQSIGCGLVIDDFSMADGQLDLLRLPGVRMVKLDPKLTNEATADVFSQAIVAAATQIARVCGFFTVAKSVETESIRDHCRSLGLDFVQGFAVSGPTPLESIPSLEAIEVS
ncbi:MAG: EAL domain-containing protein [Steroidobacteraceae bacterium]|jgi:EAL domain-containing protein (putative c-di-GMP-specific phosphodiesterase class I)|nr:EAL domain-containing protein [Steroidobacteraceae bacterium]